MGRLASYLVKNWYKLSGPVRWAIEQVAGWGIVNAVEAGYNALVDYLSGFGGWIIDKISGIIGI